MLVLTFTDAETAQISAESQTFAAKLHKLASLKNPALSALSAPSPQSVAETQVTEFLQGLAKSGMQTQVKLVREWAKEKGLLRYSSLAGAKRIVEEYHQKQKELVE